MPIKKKKCDNKDNNISIKPFHLLFPYALEWYTKESDKKIQHKAYFPYEDYRDGYAKKLKFAKAIGIRKFKTQKRND